MNFWTPLYSLFLILFTRNWKKNTTGAVAQFENDLAVYLKGGPTVLTSHARIAFFHILKFLNLPRGSEILMTPINLPEMLKMVRLNGLDIKFINYKKNSFSLDFSELLINPSTKIIFYTPISGIHTDMDELQLFVKNHKLLLIMDLTQSFSGTWGGKPLHTYGEFSFYSFCDLKTIHTHRGGLVVTENIDFHNYMKEQNKVWFKDPLKKYFLNFVIEDFIAILLLNRIFFNFISKWILFVCNYLDPGLIENITAGHSFNIFMASGNYWDEEQIPPEQKYHYTDMQAKIGIWRLKLFPEIDQKRHRNILYFYNLLSPKGQTLIPKFDFKNEHVFWRSPIIVDDFYGFQKFMLKGKIDVARSNLPWLPDLLRQNICQGREMKFNCVYIPIHHYLSLDEVRIIANRVNEYAEGLT